MEENNDLKEISIILGLKEHSSELILLNKNILDKKGLSFINYISNILFSDNINEIYEKLDINNDNNGMIDDFIKKTQIEGVGPVKLEFYKNSNFIENIKGNEKNLQIPNVNYTEKYLLKLQNEFIKEEKVVVPPVEIKEQNIKRYEDKKKNYKNKNTHKKKKDEINQEDINENKEIQEKKEIEIENKEEDVKEIKENIENEISNEQNKDYEDYEKNEDKKNDGNNQQRSNNRRNYNKKYNKNKGHKEYRQNYNSRKFKNYK